MCWGSRIIGWTLVEVVEHFLAEGTPEPNWSSVQAALDQIAAIPLVPLITPDGLVWEEQSS